MKTKRVSAECRKTKYILPETLSFLTPHPDRLWPVLMGTAWLVAKYKIINLWTACYEGRTSRRRWRRRQCGAENAGRRPIRYTAKLRRRLPHAPMTDGRCRGDTRQRTTTVIVKHTCIVGKRAGPVYRERYARIRRFRKIIPLTRRCKTVIFDYWAP